MKSPAEILIGDYIGPSGMSTREFADAIGVSRFSLARMLKGSIMGLKFISKLAMLTRTSVKYWYFLQTEWLYFQFLKKRKAPTIAQIKSSIIEKESLINAPIGDVLKDFMLYNSINVSKLAREINVDKSNLTKLLKGEQRITVYMAAKIGSAFCTGTKYWLDLQSKVDLQKYLEGELAGDKLTSAIKKFLATKATFDLPSCNLPSQQINPVVDLLTKRILKLGIFAEDCRRLLCVSKKVFYPIIEGKNEMPVAMIIKIARLFDADALALIAYQNKYFSEKSQKFVLSNRPPREYSLNRTQMQNDFLLPMKWTLSDFAEYIGVSKNHLYRVATGQVRIDFETAERMGTALSIDPKYWIWKQAEADIRAYQSVR